MTDSDHFAPGYRTQKTDERVSVIGRRFLKVRAEALAARHAPILPSYHTRVEKVRRRPFLYEVVAYQNKMVAL